MAASADDDAAKRDAVLRRMLATPKPGKKLREDDGPKSAHKAPAAKRKRAKASSP